MTLVFQTESWPQYFADPERESLWLQHYDEFWPSHQGRMPFGPNWAAYAALAEAGVLSIVTARRASRLVGHSICLVSLHMHYPTVCGFEDVYYLTPGERRGMVGYRLIRETLQALRVRGAQKVFFHTKEFASVGRLFSRLGMTKSDEVYTMWIGD